MSASTVRISGLILAAFGACLFSMKGIVMKLAFEEGADVELMMALRMGIALPIFIAVGVLSARRTGSSQHGRDVWLSAAALGVLSYYVCTWLDFTGLQFISAQFERLILFLYPTCVAIFAWIFLGDRITWQHGVALALSYSGVAMLAVQDIGNLGPNAALGAGLVFAAAVLFAGYVTMAKSVIGKLGSLQFTSVAMTAASSVMFLHFAVRNIGFGVSSVEPTPIILIYGAMLAVGCTVLPAFMINEGIARIGPGLASAVGGVGPAATAIAAVIVLSEPFGLVNVLALVLTVAGVLLLSRARTEPSSNAQEAKPVANA